MRVVGLRGTSNPPAALVFVNGVQQTVPTPVIIDLEKKNGHSGASDGARLQTQRV